ncbi:MAG: recombinase family protein [Phycisphaerae bacterium]
MRTIQTSKLKTLRAIGYCRTSGESQRDNTSIARQKEAIESFIKHKNWQFKRHYIDECKSGSSVRGRTAFQRMLKDAELGKFDVIVPFVIDRFARDGLDILYNAKTLKEQYQVSIVSVSSSFNNFDDQNVISNYVEAGMAEQEKINIVRRTSGGRIKQAKKGKRWSPKLPVGRGYNKTTETWFVNAEGKRLKEILEKYVKGQGMKSLALEYHYPSPMSITRKIREGQLTGIYQARFTSKKHSEFNIIVPVPAVPEIIDSKLMKRVQDKLKHNRTWNQQHRRQHLFTSFLKCEHCGRSLYAQNQNGVVYYRHDKYYADDRHKSCPFQSVREDKIKEVILDYLYTFFLNEPAYNQAIENAMPDDSDRQELLEDINQTKQQLTANKKQINRLVDAIAKGADVSLLLDKQTTLIKEKEMLTLRIDELQQTLANMPDLVSSKAEIDVLRLELLEKYASQDWRDLTYKEIRQFLYFLFSDNPKKNDYGISVSCNGLYGRKRKFEISFEGCVDFSTNEELYERLIDTYDKYLDEHSISPNKDSL